jgi:hypothetical protein
MPRNDIERGVEGRRQFHRALEVTTGDAGALRPILVLASADRAQTMGITCTTVAMRLLAGRKVSELPLHRSALRLGGGQIGAAASWLGGGATK